MVTFLIAVFATAAFNIGAEAAKPTPKQACEIFLSSGIPLSNGSLPADFHNRMLVSIEDVIEFLDKNKKYPWRHDLTTVSAKTFADNKNLIYLSEFGPTLWDIKEFGEWQHAILPLRNQPQRAAKILAVLGMGGSILGISSQGATRIRNSKLARLEQLSTEKEFRNRKLLYLAQLHLDPQERREFQRLLMGLGHQPHHDRQLNLVNKFAGSDNNIELPLDPTTGKPLDIFKVDARSRSLIIELTFAVAGESEGTKTAEELRLASQSLNLHWYTDSGQQIPGKDFETIWAMRILYREALVRRKMSAGFLLGQTLNEDEIFYLAMYPEFMPAWPEAKKWLVSIREERVSSEYPFYSNSLRIPIQHKMETVFLEVQRVGMEDRPLYLELPKATLVVHRGESEDPFTDSEHDHVKIWLQKEWSAFQAQYSLKLRSQPLFSISNFEDTIAIDLEHPLSEKLMIAFFAFLSENYLQANRPR